VEIPWNEIETAGMGRCEGEIELTKNVSPTTGLWLNPLPRKVMDVSYFAETKGVVRCHYKCRLAFKVRDLEWFLN
jgi:hypothetical protein